MNQTFLTALGKSTALHVVLIVVLVASAEFSPSQPKVMEVTLNAPANPQKQAVEAMAVDADAVAKRIEALKAEDAKKKAQEQQRIKDLEKRAQQARKEREAEARRIKKLEAERKRKEREKQKADEAAKKAKQAQKQEQAKAEALRKQKLAEEKAAQDAQKKRQAEEEALKKAEAERKRQAEIAKRKAEEAKQKALAEQLLQEQLAMEQAARTRARQQQALTEVEKYKAMIMGRIQQNLLIDEKMKGKQCKLNLKLAFNGLVTSVTPQGGDKLVCEAALRAVRMTDRLPVSKDPMVFEQLKNINLTIKPEI